MEEERGHGQSEKKYVLNEFERFVCFRCIEYGYLEIKKSNFDGF
jgi:hypothetical protein